MKTRILILCVMLLPLTGMAQNYIEPDKPEETEVWKPKPEKVIVTESSDNIPSDAILLLEENLEKWQTADGKSAPWIMKDGVATVKKKTGSIYTKQLFGDIQMHMEWRIPEKVVGSGQHRGNSGVFLQGKYEVQILDSYENETYANGQAGAIYKQSMPLVNASKKPGEWQTYDIIFHAPVFSNIGQKISPATITVIYNGVLVQDNTKILGTTEYIGWPKNIPHGKGPIILQEHDANVNYRNIWVREL